MKKQTSTSQFLSARDKPTSSTLTPHTIDTARLVRKRKVIDNLDSTAINIKEPLGMSTISNVVGSGQPTSKNKTQENVLSCKRTKENYTNANKKSSLSSIHR
jgi:hypothetical protein